MHLLDKLHDIISSKNPVYNNLPVIIQKGILLDMSPDKLIGYSNEIMLGLMAFGGTRPLDVFGTSMMYHSKLFELAVRGLKGQSEQQLEAFLSNLLVKFLDYSDDVIIDIQVNNDIDKVGYTQNGNIEMSYTISVNTINLHETEKSDILTTETQMTEKKEIGGIKDGTTNRSIKQSVQRKKVGNYGTKQR